LALIALLLSVAPSPALALTITVNGQAGNWASVSALAPADPADNATRGLDIRSVFYTNSSSTLYLRYDTTTAAAWPNTTAICFNSSGLITGNQTVSGCGSLTQIDYRLLISGTPTGPNNALTITLQECNTGGNCNTTLAVTGLAAASAGTVVEIAVPLRAIGVISPGLSAALDVSVNTNALGAGGDSVRYDDLSLPSPTPVTLTTFTATAEGNTVRVAWRTAMELDMLGYQVLRSTTGARADAVAMLPDLVLATGIA
jgi:hypothetical protein